MQSEEITKEKLKSSIRYYGSHIRQDTGNLVKWLVLSILTGVIVGGVSTAFAYALTAVTQFRVNHSWSILLLPISGVCIVFLYDKFGRNDGGTNQVFSTVRSKDEVPILAAPLIFISTALTHLAGGSAGREGAALQLGGSIANQLGRWIHLDEEDTHVIVMCGMSAAFAALFGTPMAAAVFSLEVVSVGVMYYAALMPCIFSALIAASVAHEFGVHAEAFDIIALPELKIISGLKIGAVALGCAAVSILFCMALRAAGQGYRHWIKNKYLRVLAASGLIIGITAVLQTTDYMGSGTELIVRAVEEGKADHFAFFWKLLLTALTMKAGFKGGEIVPSFCIGATFGCVMGELLGISPSACAACGMIAVFCGVTNCPLTSLLIAFELFGYEGVPFYLVTVAISYATSGYYSLYKAQTIVYSKYKAKYVNQHTRS